MSHHATCSCQECRDAIEADMTDAEWQARQESMERIRRDVRVCREREKRERARR
jgi:hypothetical protein